MAQYPDFLYRFQEGHIPGYNNIYERNDFFNMLNDRENVNKQNRLTTEGINNIVAAYFIKTVQQKRSNTKPIETIISTKDEEAVSPKGVEDIHADLCSVTNNQLSNVNDLMKRIIEKDYSK
jgi:hypothetical protein